MRAVFQRFCREPAEVVEPDFSDAYSRKDRELVGTIRGNVGLEQEVRRLVNREIDILGITPFS